MIIYRTCWVVNVHMTQSGSSPTYPTLLVSRSNVVLNDFLVRPEDVTLVPSTLFCTERPPHGRDLRGQPLQDQCGRDFMRVKRVVEQGSSISLNRQSASSLSAFESYIVVQPVRRSMQHLFSRCSVRARNYNPLTGLRLLKGFPLNEYCLVDRSH